MTTSGNPTIAYRRAPALSLALAMTLASATLSAAGDTAPEHAQLAALARQLDLLDRTARHSASLARAERARYHFDYARLQQDIERIRAGVRDYLTPQRAQPRDPIELLSDYRQPDRPSDEEGSQ